MALGQDQIVALACIMSSKTIRTIFNPTYHYTLHREGAISYRKTSYPENAAKLYYQCMKKYIELYNISNRDVMDILSKYVFNTAMLTNYKLFYDAFTLYLFPYTKVRNDSRIIVYGAGNLGVEIVNAIDSDNRFEIVAWVDKNRKNNERSSHMIESPKIIVEREYDYIIVAVMNAEVSMKIREELAKMVDVNKVILMGYDNMSMKRLDEIFTSK